MRKILRKLSLFLLVAFLTMASVFYINNSNQIKAQENLQGIDLSGQTKIIPGIQLSYYLNISTTGLPANELDGSYSLIYLDKNIFVEPQLVNISTERYVASREILPDNDYYIIKITYNDQLRPGSISGLPFLATVKNHVLHRGDQVTIKNKFFANNGGEIVSKDNVFDVKLYDWKQIHEDWHSEVDLGLNSVNDDRSKAKIDRINFDSFYLNAWDSEANSWPQFNGTATDPRRIKITVDLSNIDFGYTFNPSYDGWNSEFTFDDTTKTLTAWYPPISHGDSYGQIQNYFTLTVNDLQNGPVLGKKYEITYKAEIEERDGQLTELATRKMSRTYRYKPLVINANPITLDELGMQKQVHRRLSSISIVATPYMEEKYYYNLVYSTPENKYPAGKKFKVRELYDLPDYEMVLHSYSFVVFGNDLTETEKAALENNKLIGVNLDDSEEIIAEDVQINPNWTSYIRDTNNDLPNKKAYKKIRLVFAEEVELTTKTEGGNFSFGLGLSTNMNPTQEIREKIQNYFKEEYDKRKATDPYFRPVYQIKNTFGIKNNTEDRDEFILTNVLDLATTSSAERWAQSLTTDQGSSISAITTSNKLKHSVGLYAQGLKPEIQPLKDLKYVLLLPEGIEAENIAPDPNKVAVTATLERVVKNYKDTGRNAHIYSIEGFTVPAATEQHPHVAHEMAMIADLKVTSATKKGSNVITGFYTWSNTELNEIFVNNHETDNLDVDDDGSKTERVVMSDQEFNFIEPREFSIIKHSKFSSEVDEKYSLTANVDTAKPTDYRITINNNTNSSRDNIDVIDILPRNGDKEIVKDAYGVYLDCGSQFKMQLTGPIAPVTGYKYLYSTTTPYESLADNINLANWVDETGIADFRQVTMFRI